MQRRVAAINDISCFGKCSLTTAVPIISAAGIETAVIPTAILSTHTGGFSGYTFRDLTDDIIPVARHWKQSGVSADAVYTGYLGSSRQIDSIITAIELIGKPNSAVIVDPVMADNGKLYSGFAPEFPEQMCCLCKKADIITPNITEALFLLGEAHMPSSYSRMYITDLIESLYALTGSKIVLTGVSFGDNEIGAVCYDGKKSEFILSERVKAFYHGTGDVFASTFVAALMNGMSLRESATIAVDFTYISVRHTFEHYPDMHYSVAFEEVLPELIKILEQHGKGKNL